MAHRPIRRRTVLLGAAAAAAATQLPKAAQAEAYPVFNIKTDFGALGNGVANDSAAFRAAKAAVVAAGGGTLDIPAGVYIVGEETAGVGASGTAYYKSADIFNITAADSVDFLHIRGTAGAVLRLKAGLHYGAFFPIGHASAGQAYHAPGAFTTASYAAEIGWMIGVIAGGEIIIEDLELDGNNDQLVIGGRHGNVDIQLKATGIRLLQNADVTITDVYTHHHGLDGLTLGWGGLTTSDPLKPHVVTRVRSEYNGRQGLSWTGGNSLTVTDSQFNHTGRGAIQSLPKAGLDIEAESSITRNGYFNNCEFVNNVGEGVNCTTGDSGYTRFEGCTFWGTTNFSAYTSKPGLVFKWCNFHGQANVGYGDPNDALTTKYAACLFEDREWTNGQVFRDGYLIADAGPVGDNVRYTDCTFRALEVRSVWTAIPTGTTPVRHFIHCTFEHRYTGVADLGLQWHGWGSRLVGCGFTEAMGTTTNRYYINLNDVVVDASPNGVPTTVSGPKVRWGNPTTGLTGTIPVGPYG
ncbi:MAG TPA: right-handed parallel beta-helix repeat-containing protein [Candidatus Limnocylindrales bacterium]